MWETKEFKTKDAMHNWIAKNKNRYQINEIFIDNGYCLEYRLLKRVY